MSAVQDVADRAYRTALAQADGAAVDASEIQERVVGALVECVRYGGVDLEDVTQEWAAAIARRTDRRHTAAGKDVIRDFARGQLGWTDLLDVVCPVGEGSRILFRNMTAMDLAAANELRYANVRNAQGAFEDWTLSIFNRVLPVLVARHATIGEAVAEGWLS